MENLSKRDGRPVDEVGSYNPITKKFDFNTSKIQKWLNYGVKPTETVLKLFKKFKIISY